MPSTKAFAAARVKQLGDSEEGTFEAIVSVFDNIDHGGDRVVKGAFDRTLNDWQASGDPIPVIFSHDWGNPDAIIGKVVAAEERDEGLWVKGQLWMDDPNARKAWRLMNERVVKEFSFGFSVRRERTAKDGANELLDLDLIEVGPTLKGMNPATQLLGVKAGRAISKATEIEVKAGIETIEQGLSIIRALITQVEATADEGKSEVEDEAGNGKSSISDEDLRLKAEIEELLGT